MGNCRQTSGASAPFLHREEFKNQIHLGTEDFEEKKQSKVNRNQRLSEIPKSQKRPVAQPLSWYLEKYQDRNTAIIEAFSSGGYNMRQIGDHVSLHYSRISRIISLAEKARIKTCPHHLTQAIKRQRQPAASFGTTGQQLEYAYIVLPRRFELAKRIQSVP